jgi:hypothetical protein
MKALERGRTQCRERVVDVARLVATRQGIYFEGLAVFAESPLKGRILTLPVYSRRLGLRPAVFSLKSLCPGILGSPEPTNLPPGQPQIYIYDQNSP